MKIIATLIAIYCLLALARAENSISCKALTENPSVEVKVVAKEESEATIRKRMTALSFPAAEVEEKAAKASAYAVVTINRSTVRSGNLENFAFVILSESGEVLKREAGKYDVPEVPSRSGGSWWNIQIVRFDDFDRSIKLRVVDLLANTHDEFSIFKTAVVKAQADAARAEQEQEAKQAAERDRYRKDPQLANREAMERFPALAVKGSPFNAAYVARYKRYQQENSGYFTDPAWPIKLAEECAKEMPANASR